MREVRMPAQCVSSLVGADTLSSTDHETPAHSIHKNSGKQHCALLSFVPPASHKARYVQLLDLIKDFKDSFFNRKNHKYFYYHLDERGQPVRKIRTDFSKLLAEGSALVMHYYDVLTGEIGWLENDKWIAISYKTLSERLGVSLARIKVLFKFLKLRKFVSVKRLSVHKEDGRIRGRTARKTLTPSFIIQSLGIKAWRKIQRLKAKLLKEGRRKIVEEEKTIINTVGKVFNTISHAAKSLIKGMPKEKSSGRGEQIKVAYANLKNKGLPIDEITRELKRLFPPI